MDNEHRQRLLTIHSTLDRLQADAEAILSGPVYADINAMAEELRELIVDMQAKAEEKLDQPTA